MTTQYLGKGIYGLQPPPWVTGVSIPKGQWLTSPADNEIYQRIATTGTDTVDPADDLVKYVARSYERTAAIAGGGLVTPSGVIANIGGATKTALGVITVGARTSALYVTGRGCIDYLAFVKNAAGTSRIEVFVDGLSKFDQSDTYTTSNGLLVLGAPSQGSSANMLNEMRPDPAGVQFRRSLEVFVTNTATASGANAGIAYHLRSVA